jgi:hypothetical protein
VTGPGLVKSGEGFTGALLGNQRAYESTMDVPPLREGCEGPLRGSQRLTVLLDDGDGLSIKLLGLGPVSLYLVEATQVSQNAALVVEIVEVPGLGECFPQNGICSRPALSLHVKPATLKK